MITSIKREFNLFPNIVGIVTTDDLTVITTTDYFSTQLAAVELLNNGVWQWENEDLVLIYYATAQIGFFTYDAATDAFVALAANGGLSSTLPSGDIFVGNASNVATGVAVSGILAMSNAGVTSIPLTSAHILVGSAGGVAAGVAVSGVVAITNAGVTSIPLASADLLVGSGGGVAAPVALSGDATIANTGVITIGSGAVTGAKIAANTVDYANIALDVIGHAQVTLTAAQFNGMYAAPVLLVAAPGSNSMLIVDSVELVMTYGSAAFASGGVVAVQYDSTADGAGVIASSTEAAADFFATASTVFKLGQGAVLAPFTTCADKGLYLSNVTGAFTTGTGSSFIVKVRYHVISTIA